MANMDLPTGSGAPDLPFSLDLSGCYEGRIGQWGVSDGEIDRYRDKIRPVFEDMQREIREGALPIARVTGETRDIEEAEAALDRLTRGARTLVFFGTGGSSLGGQALAQLAGWNLPGVASRAQRKRPRTRFYDNLDPITHAGALESLDLENSRFIFTSKSGGTTETLAQVITTLSAVKAAGLEDRIPHMFLGITEPAMDGRFNGLRALFEAHGIPMLPHPTDIGGRFSCLSIVGMMPAMARGLDPLKIRSGARQVAEALASASDPLDAAPAASAFTSVAMSKEHGIGVMVMMPYTDRLGYLSRWYVQLWAESLGKGGEGTSAIAAVGPLDQHSQLQLFMDGPREHLVTVIRVPVAGTGAEIDAELAALAGASYMGGRSIGDVVGAQAAALPDALVKAGRPVRTIDIHSMDEAAIGAVMMHFMLETILTGRLLGIDPFDQPAVELAKVLTRERLSSADG